MERIKVTFLDIHIPGQEVKKIKLDETFTIGSDRASDLEIEGLAPIQFKFRQQNKILTLMMLGPKDSGSIGSQKLQRGKMYILDVGDKIRTGDIKIFVSQSYEDPPTAVSTPFPPQEAESLKTSSVSLEKSTSPSRSSLPGAFIRLEGMALDIFLSSNLGPWLLHSQVQNKKFQELFLVPFQGTLSSPFAEILSSFSLFLFYFALFRLASTLLFGVPLPLFLMGVKNKKGGFLINRLKGLGRECLGLFTFPFLVFDLPLLFGRRGFKEVVTGTYLRSSGLILTMCGSIILLPLLFFLSLGMFLKMDIGDLFNSIHFSKFPKRTKMKTEQVPLQGTIHSLGLSLNTTHPKHWMLTPMVKREGESFGVDLFVIDGQKKQTVRLSFKGRLPYGDTIEKIRWFDPFFPLHSPHLNSWKKKAPWTEECTEEWFDIIKQSLSLSFPHIPRMILTKGFFLYPYEQIKKDILSFLDERTLSDLEILRIGEEKALLAKTNITTKVFLPKESSFYRWTLVNRGGKASLNRPSGGFLQRKLPSPPPRRPPSHRRGGCLWPWTLFSISSKGIPSPPPSSSPLSSFLKRRPKRPSMNRSPTGIKN